MKICPFETNGNALNLDQFRFTGVQLSIFWFFYMTQKGREETHLILFYFYTAGQRRHLFFECSTPGSIAGAEKWNDPHHDEWWDKKFMTELNWWRRAKDNNNDDDDGSGGFFDENTHARNTNSGEKGATIVFEWQNYIGWRPLVLAIGSIPSGRLLLYRIGNLGYVGAHDKVARGFVAIFQGILGSISLVWKSLNTNSPMFRNDQQDNNNDPPFVRTNL